jgi:hypothetical protein
MRVRSLYTEISDSFSASYKDLPTERKIWMTFSKSVALDLESFLIKYMSSDKKYILQNGNGGIHDHEYYNRLEYRDEFRKIWEKLRKLGVVDNSLDKIENSEIFKYSPYRSATYTVKVE